MHATRVRLRRLLSALIAEREDSQLLYIPHGEPGMRRMIAALLALRPPVENRPARRTDPLVSGRSAGKRVADERAGKQRPLRPALIAAVDQQQRAVVALRANQPPRRLNHPHHPRQGHA